MASRDADPPVPWALAIPGTVPLMGPRRARRHLTLVVVGVLVLACCVGDDDHESTTGALHSPATTKGAPVDPGIAESTTTTTDRAVDVCARLRLEDPIPIEADPALTEISGAVASRRTTDAVWVHEDSGHPTVLTEVGLEGGQISRWEVPGVEMVDWEDLAAVDDEGGARHLIIADIGDNIRSRDHVRLIRVPEPLQSATGGVTDDPAVVRLHLPEGPRDAEALLIAPETADVVVITKAVTGVAEVLVGAQAALAPNGAQVRLEMAGTLRLGPGEAVLAGDLSPDGGRLGLRTPSRVLVWAHEPDRPIDATLLDTTPCRGPSTFDLFGEALAMLDDGYVLLGESAAPQLIRVR